MKHNTLKMSSKKRDAEDWEVEKEVKQSKKESKDFREKRKNRRDQWNYSE